MLEKIAQIVGKLNGTVLIALGLGIVALVFVAGLLLSFGGELGKFKKGAKAAIKGGTLEDFQKSAKEKMPLRVKKQYKAFKQNGGKPDDYITQDACVYSPFKESVAAHLPGMVTAAGVLSILLVFFLAGVVSGTDKWSSAKFPGGLMYVVPAVVTVGVMVLRLAAGLISTAVLKGGLKTYDAYVEALGVCMGGGAAASRGSASDTNAAEIPFASNEPITAEPKTIAFDPTFGEPERINVELADEEEEEIPHTVVMQEPEPVVMQTAEPTVQPEPEPAPQPEVSAEPVITPAPQESEAETRAKARAEALARLRAEQAQREAARAQAQPEPAAKPAEPAPQPVPKTQQRPSASAQGGSSTAQDVLARIETISREGAPIATMKEVALQLQRERGKPENNSPELQQKFKEALSTLLKAMSTANKK